VEDTEPSPVVGHYTADEDADLFRLTLTAWVAKYPHRTIWGGTRRRKTLKKQGVAAGILADAIQDHRHVEREFKDDKRIARVNWRRANDLAQQMQALHEDTRSSQDVGTIDFSHLDRPILVLPWSDQHWGDWATDYATFERVTDEILDTPDLFVALVGDIAQMAIKLRRVAEVASNLFTPTQQVEFLEDWLNELSHKVLFATWCNHGVEREEAGTGISAIARILKDRVVYHNGIGHPDVIVGQQTYRFAVTHRFRFYSSLNPTHGCHRYIERQAPSRDIAIMGDIHTPASDQRWLEGRLRTGIVTGSIQYNTYGRRHFSLHRTDKFPTLLLDPEEHEVSVFPNLSQATRVLRWGALRAS
jgi:hypothetical protein